MKAPDKIYVPVIKPVFSKEQELYGEWKHQPLSLTIVKGNIEYIRKDALMEKLSRAKELRIKNGANESSDGINVIDALIKMIKEM